MNIDETVKALRGDCQIREHNCKGCEFVGEELSHPYYRCKLHNIAADQLEQLQAENEQLKASQPVTCGECKHWRMDAEYSVKGFCCNRLGLIQKTKNSDFCSYGERRE